MAADTRQATTRNKTPDEMFEAGLRELIARHFAWSKPPTREWAARLLQRAAESLKRSVNQP